LPSAPPAENVVASSPAAEPSRRSLSVPEAAEESPNFFDERFDFEEPFDLLESAEPPAAGPEAPPETTEPGEKHPRKRRRRRRRGRESVRGDSREQDLAEASAVPSTDVAPPAVADSDQFSAAAEAEAVDVEPPRDEAAVAAEERRSKRRRPRRGKKKPHAAEPSRAAAGRMADSEALSEPAQARDLETVEPRTLPQDGSEPGESDDSEAERPGRLGFRGIPTWEEAIGLIVDKNLEARTKRSGGGSHAGRGQHSPRDSRSERGGKRRS
jgi:hypothetical protein